MDMRRAKELLKFNNCLIVNGIHALVLSLSELFSSETALVVCVGIVMVPK